MVEPIINRRQLVSVVGCISEKSMPAFDVQTFTACLKSWIPFN